MRHYTLPLLALLSGVPRGGVSSRSASNHELLGTWGLRIEAGSQDSASRAKTSSVIRGSIALLRTPSYGAYEWVTAVHATHFGVFMWDKELFELPPTIRGAIADQLWDAVGSTRARDSVEIVLRPALTHGSIILRGRFEGDSIEGTISVQGYGLADAGKFVLHRL